MDTMTGRRQHQRFKPGPGLLLAGFALLVAACTPAAAQVQDTTTTLPAEQEVIWACVKTVPTPINGTELPAGILRIVDSETVCEADEQPLSWNQQGEPGIQGPQGDKGDQGDQGDRGATGATGPRGSTGARGTAS